MWPTIIVATLVAALFVLIVLFEIKKRKEGKSGCSCGGNCGACGIDCHGNRTAKK